MYTCTGMHVRIYVRVIRAAKNNQGDLEQKEQLWSPSNCWYLHMILLVDAV